MPTNVFDAGVRNRQRRMDAEGANLAVGNGPGFVGILPDESMDPFWGALHDRKDEAGAAGRGYRVSTAGLGGSDMGPMASLRRAAGPKEPEFDATEYQMGRAALDRTLNDNFARKWGQRTALNDADRARDPNLVDYDAKRKNERTAAGVAAEDESDIDSFQRREPLRRAEHSEKVQFGGEAAEVDPRVIVARETTRRGENTNQSKEDIEIIRTQGKDSVSGKQAYARIVSGMAMSGIPQEEIIKRVDTAIGDLGFTETAPTAKPEEKGAWYDPRSYFQSSKPAAPKPIDSLLNKGRSLEARDPSQTRSFPMDRYDELVQEKGSEQAADDWLKFNNWSKPIR